MAKRHTVLSVVLGALFTLAGCGDWVGSEPETTSTTTRPRAVTVEIEVTGIETAHVTYWKADGEQFSQEVKLPHHVELTYSDYGNAMAPFVLAQQSTITEPHMGKLACTIRVDGQLVAAEEDVPNSEYADREVECKAPKAR